MNYPMVFDPIDLNLFQYGGINVEVQVMEDSIQILFNQYQDGSASVLLINHSARCPVEYTQK